MAPKRAWLTVAVGMLGSQAGHLLTFQLLFGPAALRLQSSGSHAYFPTLARTAVGVIAAGVLVAIFIIGLARVVSRRWRIVAGTQQSFVELVAMLFTIQLACFIAQEVTEAVIAGSSVASAPHLLLWGTLGQLPVAAVAAMGLRWLWTRFEAAVDELRVVLIAVSAPRMAAIVAVQSWPAPDGAIVLARLARSPASRRGPPTL